MYMAVTETNNVWIINERNVLCIVDKWSAIGVLLPHEDKKRALVSLIVRWSVEGSGDEVPRSLLTKLGTREKVLRVEISTGTIFGVRFNGCGKLRFPQGRII